MPNLRDFYSRDTEAPNYSDKLLEVDEALNDLVLKIENVLFTRKTEVLGAEDFGCNLDDLIFSLTNNEDMIRKTIGAQIVAYCLIGQDGFAVDVNVKFFETNQTNGCLIDIMINDKRVIGVLY
jgi:hypothetical protein